MTKATQQHLEQRLTRVEQELANVKASLKIPRTEPWYQQIVGDFEGDEDHRQIVRLGRQIRQGKRKG